jgi:CMP-N-acetylneuraminic acid synthetase/spore coat polysaccharide biosynthesis predicted glycosyltransferase SpsG
LRTVVIVPARGGSKGIPNKNLRPLRGKPLIGWALDAARGAAGVDLVAVSTDSSAIAATAARFGARTLMRRAELAQDQVTLDPVIADAVEQLEAQGERFDLVLTVQPTSPMLSSETIAGIVARFAAEPALCTVLTAVDDTHLSWALGDDGRFVPAYEKRLNRQQLPKRFKETGGVFATRRTFVRAESRFGPRVELCLVSAVEGCDIDSPDDWLFAEAALGRRRIAFLPIGNRKQGLGHVTRVMSLIECLTGHVVQVFCDPAEDLAIMRLQERFFGCEVVPRAERLEALRAFAPDVIVHDELDTVPEELDAERALGAKLVCFEDLGAGMGKADLVFNELYPQSDADVGRGRFFGPSACVLRDEFFHAPRRPWSERAESVLVTFGGTDPSRLVFRVLDAIGAECPARLIVIAGRGVDYLGELSARCDALRAAGREVELHHDVQLMSELMGRADLAFSSAGRTLYELAHMRVPTVVLAQNALELKHTFGGPEHGFLPLGLGASASLESIRATFGTLYHAPETRKALWSRMNDLDLTSSRARVVRAIVELA